MANQPNADDRLDGWDAISEYLGWHTRTVIRWEKQKGLPVHRVPGGKRQPVYAYRHEIDLWFKESGVHGLADPSALAMADHGPDTAVHEEHINGAKGARIRPRWLTGKAALASVIVACALFFTTGSLRQTTPDLTVANPTRITQSQTRILSPLLTDGVRVYYPQYENSRYGVAEVPARGGQSTAAVTGVGNPELCDLAQGSQAMLLRDLIHTRDEDAPVYIQPKDGAAQRVGDLLVYDAAWYPDAKRILYSADGGVYSSDRAGKSRQRLFSVPGNAFWFRWAPDGRTLRFTVIDTKTEETSIWEVPGDGKNPHRLFSKLQFHLCCGTWTPDGKFYLFQARVGNTFQIWAQRVHPRFLFPAENQPFRVLSGATSYRGPVVSPDNSKLFLRAEATKAELVRYDQHSGKFVSMLPSIPARTIAFSKDGGWIAYTSLADNDLWRCRSNGKECLQLTQGFKQTVMPRWSPDGQTIAFMGLRFTGGWGVFSVPAEGGEIRSFSNGSKAQGDPDWSPDGQRLVFSDVRPVADPGGISVLDLRTNQVSQLPGSAVYFSPRWSPDGRFLVALHAGDQYLYLFEFGTAKWQRLAAVASGYPNWSQDGKHVYFLSSVAGDRAVFRVAVTDRAVEKIASLAGVEHGSFFMSDWIGLAPDDAPLAVHDLTTEDIYAWDLIAR